MYRVLLVDDEPNILSALRRCLSFMVDVIDDAVVFETFTSPLNALARLEEEDFDLIIADYRMPEMSGVKFLSRAIEGQPGIARMILSGYADRDAIVEAINETQISRFLGKPWDDVELRSTVATLLMQRRARNSAGMPGGSETDLRLSREAKACRRLEVEAPGIMQLDIDDAGGINLDFR
ncbi:MAG: response regulator [Dokdonella sp.]